MSKHPAISLPGLIATAGGLGIFVKKAPGTAGSAAACVLAVFLPEPVRLAAIAVLAAAGVWAAGAYEKSCGRADPGEVIIDEVVGQLIATIGHVAVVGQGSGAVNFLIPSFLLFRFFDILKPWPVNACEKAPGGLGIMLDDAAAGLLANLLLRGLRKIFIEGWWPF